MRTRPNILRHRTMLGFVKYIITQKLIIQDYQFFGKYI